MKKLDWRIILGYLLAYYTLEWLGVIEYELAAAMFAIGWALGAVVGYLLFVWMRANNIVCQKIGWAVTWAFGGGAIILIALILFAGFRFTLLNAFESVFILICAAIGFSFSALTILVKK